MTTGSACAATVGRNVDYPWNEFDPEAYLKHNYESVRDDDRAIVRFVRDFFAGTLSDPEVPGRRGIDVGTGANLYPALTMLPFCDAITLYEYSQSNVDWLERQSAAGWPTWDTAWHAFWDLLTDAAPYLDFRGDPRAELTRRAAVSRGSVFDLDPAAGRFDLGTMFFVAESITSERAEFHAAVERFLGVLAPNAPFAIAFMEHSGGYTVGGTRFPATDIGQQDVRDHLSERASEVRVEHVGTGTNPLREDYTGMVMACGRVKVAQHA
jgi:hypothetical protein